MSGDLRSGTPPAGNRRSTTIDIAVASLAGALALAVYVRSLAPGLLWGDSAEFQFAAWLGGFAHPTGYPLYLILGWLWTHLAPFRDPAFRMNLFSALWGGIAAAVFCLLVIRTIRFLAGDRATESLRPSPRSEAPGWVTRAIGLAAALVFVFTPTFWSQAVIAEVYTLHAAFAAGLPLALISWAEHFMSGNARGERRRSYLVALLFGLSLTHHRSTILLIPAVALFVLIVLSSAGRPLRFSSQRAGSLLLCIVAPLLLYLYVPLRARHVPYYQLPLAPGESLQLYEPTLSGFLTHVSGRVFSSSVAAPLLDALELQRLIGRFVDELSMNGLLLGALGLAALVLLAVRDRNRRCWAVIALTVGVFVTQVIFNLFYAIGDIQVFFIPAYLVWVLWMAVAVWSLLLAVRWLLSGAGERARRWTILASTLLLCAVLAALAYRSAVVYWPKVQRAGDDSARRAWAALLDSDLAQDAILVSNDRDEMAPFWYLSHVEGQRNDLTGLFPLIQPGPGWSDIGAVVDSAIQTGRPVYLVKPMPGLDVKFDLAPLEGESQGPLGPPVRVALQSPASPAHRTDIVFGDTIRLIGYDVAPNPLIPGHPAQVTLYWEPLGEMREDWATFVQVVDAAGNKAGQSDHQAGGVFYPTSLWREDERLRDVHVFDVSRDAAAGPRGLMVGLYVPSEDSLRQLGEPQVVGEVVVSR